MSPRPRSPTARAALKTILVVLLSITSLVLARALIGIEITVDGVPVAKGEVVGTDLELGTLATWGAEGDLRLFFDDGTREDAFASLRDGVVVVTTIDFGTEALVDYLRRQGIAGAQVRIESSCEIMDVDHPLFGAFCAAYDPARRPADHPDVTGLTCSTCHAPGELEDAYARAASVGPLGATPPAGHREIGSTSCSTCHTAAAGEGALAPGGPTPPPGHRPIGGATCSSCHGSTPDADGGAPIATPPPGHRDIGTQTCASCHGGTPGDGATAPVPTPPPGHRDIGTATCASCHGSGGYDDDDEDDEDHEDEDEDHEDHEDEDDD